MTKVNHLIYRSGRAMIDYKSALTFIYICAMAPVASSCSHIIEVNVVVNTRTARRVSYLEHSLCRYT